MRLTDNEFHTKENKERACCIQEPRLQQIYDKLFELEDIEEELGVSLVKLFSALKNGCFVKYKGHIRYDREPHLRTYHYLDGRFDIGLDLHYMHKNCDVTVFPTSLNNYGKTWALTKEELL